MTVRLDGKAHPARNGPLFMLFADDVAEFHAFTTRAGIDAGDVMGIGIIAYSVNEIQARIALAFGAVATDEFGYEDHQAERAGAHVSVLAIALKRAALIDQGNPS